MVGNTLVNNTTSQLLNITSPDMHPESNCFGAANPQQLAADFYFADHYQTLADYQNAKHKDVFSRQGNCGALPKKVDVHRLHAETMGYTERARKILGATPASGSATPKGTTGTTGRSTGTTGEQ